MWKFEVVVREWGIMGWFLGVIGAGLAISFVMFKVIFGAVSVVSASLV